MASIRIAPAAERDLAEMLEYLDTLGPTGTLRVIHGLRRVFQRLQRFPEGGRVPPEMAGLGAVQHREVVMESFRIVYRHTGNAVVILLIADGRRDFQALLERRLLV